MKRYDHMLDVAFRLTSEHEYWADIPVPEIIAALERRVANLKKHADIEAFGHCDTFEIEDAT